MLFIKLLKLNLFKLSSPFSYIYIFRKNTIETSLTSKKCRLAKFYKVDASSQMSLFKGVASFLSRDFRGIKKTD